MPHTLRAMPAHLAIVVLACASAAASVHAQSAGLPAMQGQGTVRHVCGGIGTDESTAMRAAMKDHPLSLLFARSDGAYLADVAVAIRGTGGAPSLQLRASGPVCLIDLPAGSYSVEATSDGVSKRQNVSVGGGPKTADFRF